MLNEILNKAQKSRKHINLYPACAHCFDNGGLILLAQNYFSEIYDVHFIFDF